MRRRVIAGNWKMYKTQADTRAFFAAFNPLVAGITDCDIVIAPPFTSIPAAVEAARARKSPSPPRTFSGKKKAHSPAKSPRGMLVEAGCRYIIIGHSERRHILWRNQRNGLQKDESGARRGTHAHRLHRRNAGRSRGGRTENICQTQFHGSVGALTPEEFSRILIAYEPVWAIGTGRTATPEIAAAVHKFVRQCAAEMFTGGHAAALRILYGGSVKPDNIQGLMAQEELDGALVGGASLDPKSFASIVKDWPR